ncbi:MAG: TonB family protein [Candidatus Acidoferrum typicum]|nr:TonB family protein [Candidatus Acidoferrum typicum]
MLNQHVFFLGDMPGASPRRSVVLPPTQASQQEVFADAILEGSSVRQKRHPLKWAVSLSAHLGVLILLLLMPLYFSQGLNMQRLNMTLLVAPLPPAAAPPPPPPSAAPRVVRAIPKTFTPGKLTAPSFVPKAVVTAPDAAVPEEAFVGVAGGVPGGVTGGQIGGVLGGVMNGVAAPAAPVVAEGPRKPVTIGGNVKPPRLLFGPAPVYPILAKQSRIQGIVVIEAIIDEHGNVIEEKAISGHPLLIPAAMKAVSQRKYEPTVLDGQPTPVDLRVEVNFHAE